MYTDVVSHCANDHSIWYNDLRFYKDDFGILEKRLDEIAAANTGKDVMTSVEHFQNQFIVQKNNIDELLHSINIHNDKVASDAKLHAGKMESGLQQEHERLRDQVGVLQKVVNDLRHEFNLFLTERM
ncbi:MAG: hypothetical protein ABUT20_31740 [Bacteroidota bacterium]